MNVEVEIYMNNLIKFFKKNPNDLINLIPIEKENEFFERIKNVAQQNFENGVDVSLTQKQLIEICVEITQSEKKVKVINKIFQSTKFGEICLN
jgi:sugar-specific transcriptional regulator TrmB